MLVQLVGSGPAGRAAARPAAAGAGCSLWRPAASGMFFSDNLLTARTQTHGRIIRPGALMI